MTEDDAKGEIVGAVVAPGSFDDGVVVEIGGDQALWFRVGPVYDSTGTMTSTHGIWIEYQKEYMRSEMQGPVLLDHSLWQQVKEYISERMWDDR